LQQLPEPGADRALDPESDRGRLVIRPAKTAPALALTLTLALFAGACGESDDPTRPSQIVAEVSAKITTVVNVRWTTQQPTTGYVEFGPTPQMEFRTATETQPVREHTATLLGLTADTVTHYRAVTWDGGPAAASGVATIRTGDLPVGLPALTLTGSGHQEFVVVPILTGGSAAVTIINPQGKIVWYHRDERDLDFYRARLALDGKSLLYNAANVSGEPSADSQLVRVALDGSRSDPIPIPLLRHDFVEMPDGTLAAIVAEYRDVQGTEVRGDKIVEIAPDGTQKIAWTAWDCFDPAVVLSDDPQQGWTFANALDYDPAADVYYLGMRNLSSIARINRQTRTCEWVLGLRGATLTFAQGAERFLHQHQFHVRGNRIVILDNEGMGGNRSRVLEYELDLASKVATQVWSYTSTPSVYTFVLGEPNRFDDGGTFINWSAAGQMERLNPAGMQTWKLNTGAGFIFGFHTLAASLYPALD
jgi:hypothetical protein